MKTKHCPYCGSSVIEERYRGHFHKFDASHGPFDFDVCQDCGAGFCNPMPSPEQLRFFYANYESGMPEEYRHAMNESEESSWHTQIAKDLVRLARIHNLPEGFAWMDVGAGAGEIACQLQTLLPRSAGTCLDLHEPPEGVSKKGISWMSGDINGNFSQDIPKRFNLVYASAVLEHVISPRDLITNCLALTDRGGLLYMFCPDYSSLASKVMGTRWPYYLPGEHLTLPTVGAIHRCLESIRDSGRVGIASVTVRRKRISYAMRYMLFALGLHSVRRYLPFDFSLKFPTGCLELIVKKA